MTQPGPPASSTPSDEPGTAPRHRGWTGDAGHQGPSDPAVGQLTEELAAERAGTAYWRSVALQRRIDAARVQKRPLVRVAIAVDRRTGRLQDRLVGWVQRWRHAWTRLAVRLGALVARPQRRHRRARLASILETGDGGSGAADGSSSTGDVLEVIVADADPDTVQTTVAASTATHICLRTASCQGVSADWSAALVTPIVDAAVPTVTTPQVIHPDRPLVGATPHDLLVRWQGVDVEVVDDVPLPVARRAGAPPDPGATPEPADAAGPSALAMSRAQWDLLGGLETGLDAEAALVELSLRARANGAAVLAVPAAVTSDSRPVDDPTQLRRPFDPAGASWRAIVDRHGPALVRRARAADPEPAASIAITTATPSRKISARSGDWHFANSFAAALRRDAHRVRVQSIEEADDLAGRSCDLHVVLRGLEPVRRTTGQLHVIWVISHPEALDIAECHEADLVLVASHRFAAHLRDRTRTPVEVLLQATDPHHFAPRAPDPQHRHPLTVVASSRGVARGAVADAVAAGLRPAIYGTGWQGLADPTLVVSQYASFDELPVVYSSAEVVLNDHWETMRRWGFVSNRIFDVLATGTTIVSDHLPEITDLFDDLVPTWRDRDELRAVVDGLGADREATAARTEAARQRVLAHHTFDHRVAELHRALERHGLIRQDGAT